MSVGLLEVKAANVPMSVFTPVGLADVSSAGKLQTSIADIAERLYRQLNDISIQAACAPTVKDFNDLREHLIPSYIKLSIALSNVVLAKLDEAELPGMIYVSFESLESEFSLKAPSYFGEEEYHEIMFSVSTLKSTYRWLPTLLTTKLDHDPELHRQDMELAREFNIASLWANFHLDVLRSALRKNQTIIPEVLQELLEGLRMSVMAYSYVRQALDLRNVLGTRYSEPLEVSWDEEDEALANAR